METIGESRADPSNAHLAVNIDVLYFLLKYIWILLRWCEQKKTKKSSGINYIKFFSLFYKSISYKYKNSLYIFKNRDRIRDIWDIRFLFERENTFVITRINKRKKFWKIK